MADKKPPPLEERANAVEVLEWSMARVRAELADQKELRLGLIEQLRICELMIQEATNAEAALERLLVGGMLYDGNESILARWDDYEQRTEAPFNRAQPVVSTAEPESDATETTSQEPPPPSDQTPASVSTETASADAPRDLTDKQWSVFDALCKIAGADWRASASQGRLSKLSGISTGALTMHVDALVKKGYIIILDRGGPLQAAIYLICEAMRPARAEAPKTDEELIAEAVANGKVTVCPPPHQGMH